MTDLRQQKLTTALKWILGLVGAAIIAPGVFLAVQGLVGLALAGFIGLAIVNFAPLVARTMAVAALKGFKGLARTNPVEVRQEISGRKRAQLKAAEDALSVFRAEIMNVERHARELRASGDDEGWAEINATAEKLTEVLNLRIAAYKKAVVAADEYDALTKKVDRRWKAAQAAAKAKRLAGPAVTAELDRIMSEESVEAADMAMNTVFAELDHALAMEQLEHKPAAPLVPVIDVKAKEVA